METEVTSLHHENKILAKLDEEISQVIIDFSKKHRISRAEVVGVLRSIELRLFFDEL